MPSCCQTKGTFSVMNYSLFSRTCLPPRIGLDPQMAVETAKDKVYKFPRHLHKKVRELLIKELKEDACLNQNGVAGLSSTAKAAAAAAPLPLPASTGKRHQNFAEGRGAKDRGVMKQAPPKAGNVATRSSLSGNSNPAVATNMSRGAEEAVTRSSSAAVSTNIFLRDSRAFSSRTIIKHSLRPPSAATRSSVSSSSIGSSSSQVVKTSKTSKTTKMSAHSSRTVNSIRTSSAALLLASNTSTGARVATRSSSSIHRAAGNANLSPRGARVSSSISSSSTAVHSSTAGCGGKARNRRRNRLTPAGCDFDRRDAVPYDKEETAARRFQNKQGFAGALGVLTDSTVHDVEEKRKRMKGGRGLDLSIVKNEQSTEGLLAISAM